MRKAGDKAPQRVELSCGGAVDVRPLGWEEVGQAIEDNRDPGSGRLNRVQYQRALLKASIVDYHDVNDEQGGPLTFPARLDDVIADFSAFDQRRVQDAALRLHDEAAAELGKSGPTSKD